MLNVCGESEMSPFPGTSLASARTAILRSIKCLSPAPVSDLDGVDGQHSPPGIHGCLFRSQPCMDFLCSPSLADQGNDVYYSPGVLLVNTSSVTAVFDGTVAVSVSAASGMLSVVCSLPDRYRSSTRGLLGEGFWHRRTAGVKILFPF